MSRIAVLSVLFWGAVALSAVAPFNPHDYWLEIATPVLGFVLLAATLRRFRFTRLAYTLMFLEGLVLIVGAHYTHERVPAFDWLKAALDLSRNHYDRFAHFCVGLLLVVPVREILARTTALRGRSLAVMSVVSILAFAGFYEITEWWVAAATSPETGAAYLGAQGDPWDAQKDMLLDWMGAVLGSALFSARHDRELAEL